MSEEKMSEKTSVDEELQEVFSLMVARSRGEVGSSDDAVEQAVSKVLAHTDNYDNLEEQKEPSTSPKKTIAEEATVESLRKDKNDDDDKEDSLEQIPLGTQGARMMVTFGDGHNPIPRAVSKALLGARRSLQLAIMDARALRRHEKEEYKKARMEIQLTHDKCRRGAPTGEETKQEAVDTSMHYRAMQGRDKLAFDPKCGFDIEQLRELFPEEMQAYKRWNDMHQAYESSKADSEAAVENESETVAGKKVPTDCDVPVSEGHLEQRAAQFDVRTDLMDNDWYLKFSKVRQGSFLPRRKGGTKSQDERQWEKKRKSKGLGTSRNTGNWENLSATSVRFLHWVGFDPRSALPPPNEETTEALAFLAYDFLGRIIEKAIYLRNIANKKDDKNLLLELQAGEQLEPADIDKALQDSAVRPASLYSAKEDESSKPQVATQLYFGPGFESRLEMEMDELVSGTKRKRLSVEEQEIRKREEELFSRLGENPVALDGFLEVCGGEESTTGAPENGSQEESSP